LFILFALDHRKKKEMRYIGNKKKETIEKKPLAPRFLTNSLSGAEYVQANCSGGCRSGSGHGKA